MASTDSTQTRIRKGPGVFLPSLRWEWVQCFVYLQKEGKAMHELELEWKTLVGHDLDTCIRVARLNAGYLVVAGNDFSRQEVSPPPSILYIPGVDQLQWDVAGEVEKDAAAIDDLCGVDAVRWAVGNRRSITFTYPDQESRNLHFSDWKFKTEWREVFPHKLEAGMLACTDVEDKSFKRFNLSKMDRIRVGLGVKPTYVDE